MFLHLMHLNLKVALIIHWNEQFLLIHGILHREKVFSCFIEYYNTFKLKTSETAVFFKIIQIKVTLMVTVTVTRV